MKTTHTSGSKVGELIERINQLSESINQINNITAQLHSADLTRQQAKYAQQIEIAIQSFSTSIEHAYAEFQINQGTQKTEDQYVNKEINSISGIRILLVEDDQIIRTVGENILSRNGAKITVAQNGKIATELTATNIFDIILMDIQMPVMNGFDATRIIREEQKCTTPIVGLTANLVQNAEDQYLQAGMSDVLSKPYNLEMLANIIHKWTNTQNINELNHQFDTYTSNNPLFNLDKLREIGDKSFVNRMLQLFVDQVSPSVAAIRKAYNEKDFATVRYITHRIRPSILNMGIDSVKSEVTEIELLANTNESSNELDAMISKLENVMDRVTAQVRMMLQG